MTTTTELFDADTALAAIEIAGKVQYRWERRAIEALVTRGLQCTQSYVWVSLSGNEILAGWQLRRLKAWGLLEYRFRYDDRCDAASRFDAPIAEDRYVATPLARAVAASLGIAS
jgi:hypothetical protein